MDWNNMQTWHWFAIAGGVVLLLGIILYFVPAGKLKIPGIVMAAFGGLAVGLALGIMYMGFLGYAPLNPNPPGEEDQEANAGGGPPGKNKGGLVSPMPGGGAPKGKGGPGGGFGGPPGGGFSVPPSPPGPRTQLVVLVDTLDKVVDKPVAVNLTPEERAAIAKELTGLDGSGDVSNDVAAAKLQAIQKILEKNRKALEAVGYRWVTDGKRNPPPKESLPKDAPSPFKDGAPSEHLKSLMERLAKK